LSQSGLPPHPSELQVEAGHLPADWRFAWLPFGRKATAT